MYMSTLGFPPTGRFFARNGMYVSKSQVRHERQSLLHDPPNPQNPDGSLNFPSLRRKFALALNEFSYRWRGDPMRGFFGDADDSDDDSDTEEFPEIKDREDIANTPVKECLELLRGNFKLKADKEVLEESFRMFVEFAFAISRRVEDFGNLEFLKESVFFTWVFKSIVEGAKVMRVRGIKLDDEMRQNIVWTHEEFGKITKIFTMKLKKKPAAVTKELDEKKEEEKKEEEKEVQKTIAETKGVETKEVELKEPERNSEKEVEREKAGKKESQQSTDTELEKALEKAYEQLLREQKQ